MKPRERHIPDFENGWAFVEETPSVFFEPTELEYHMDSLVVCETCRIWTRYGPRRMSDENDGADDEKPKTSISYFFEA